MRRDPAKKLLMKLQLETRGIRMNVKSKKKKLVDGYMRVIENPSKKKKIFIDIVPNEFKEFLIYL